ncbi:MAG: MerR family transcriptional regulator [Alphaproteobacteria bacterium]|nr:MerR family transcriptional regulator [Alphaproteobacteria bacterium]
MKRQEYTRGALTKKTDCNLETIRYYEKEGLLRKPLHTKAGYRLYGEEDAKRLRFIRRCRELRFSISEIRELLSVVDGHDYTCHDISAITQSHIQDVKGKIFDLRKILKTLQDIASQCHAGSSPAGNSVECPILEALNR